MRNSRAGITLIELLVVLTLISLLSAIVGPAIGGRIDTFTLQNTANGLANRFRRAQALARAEHKPVVVTYADRSFHVLKDSKEVASFPLPPSVSAPSAGRAAYVFLPSGQIVWPGVLELENARGRRLRLDWQPLTGLAISPGGS
jgi:type II secretion system protein H